MRKSILLACAAVSFALTGCNNAADDAATDEAAADDAAAEAEAPEETASVAADGGPSAGTYEVTKADGSVHTYVANADGTFEYTNADGTTVTGTWRQDGPNRWCDTPEGGEEVCFTETMVDGVYTSVSETDPTDTSTIRRVS
jgi:uncharacterized lipoprotein NlpE involved in copper resistance